ncbi:MAG: dimethylsulfoniopropionate demethylase [Hyphomicrobiaceae bacterium]
MAQLDEQIEISDHGEFGAMVLTPSRRIRTTPFTAHNIAAGAQAYTVYNHMLLPTTFQSVEDDYWHLLSYVQLWDVSAQRQVEVAGPDALRLVQLMTPRDVTTRFDVGQCKYAPLVDQDGGMINDPVIVRVADDRFWLSIADSDVLLWARGLAYGLGLNVQISEPDVFPLAVQGPLAESLMADVFGDAVRDIRFFRSSMLQFNGVDLLVARSGWSKQGGFEIYLDVPAMADDLWNTLMAAGRPYNVRAGAPNLIERVEGGLLSYGSDMTRMNSPLECGLERYCALDGDIDFIGKSALRRQRDAGVARRIRGLVLTGPKVPPATTAWTVFSQNTPVGYLTTVAFSPRFGCNLAFAMLDAGHSIVDTTLSVECTDGIMRDGLVVELPFDRGRIEQLQTG